MRWFKHMSNSFDDEKLSAVIDELGMEGYGFWWRILEIIAEKMDEKEDCSAVFSTKKWGTFFGFSAKKFENFVKIFQKNKVFKADFFEGQVKISIPNLLKYRDEWSKRKVKSSRAIQEKLQSKKEDTDIEYNKKEDSLCSSSFLPEFSAGMFEGGAESEPSRFPEEKALLNEFEGNAVIFLPLNTGTEHPVTQDEIDQWQNLYPAVDVMQAVRNMRGWLLGNRRRRKTKAGINRFIHAWLSREQDRGGTRASPCIKHDCHGAKEKFYNNGTVSPFGTFWELMLREGLATPSEVAQKGYDIDDARAIYGTGKGGQSSPRFAAADGNASADMVGDMQCCSARENNVLDTSKTS